MPENENENIVLHEMTCEQCREMMKDEKLDKAINHVVEHRFRKMLQEEWQTTISTTKKIEKAFNIIYVMVALHGIEMIMLGGILILILTKHA